MTAFPRPDIVAAAVAKPHVVVIGSGPAGLMAADVAARGGAAVSMFERMPAPGRKFLLAGRGGLNLTHSEPLDRVLRRYGSAEASVAPFVRAFDSDALQAWCGDLGIETFVGTSGRVFPTSLKTSPLLRAWLRRLAGLGVTIRLRHHWDSWDADGALVLATPGGTVRLAADAVILALGGASWPRIGSDGSWVGPVMAAGIEVLPLRPANCGFVVGWSDLFRDRFEGAPLKNIRLVFDGDTARGDAMVTRSGLEGGAVYALSAPLRDAIARDGAANLRIALRPDLSLDALEAKLAKRQPKQSLATALRKTLGLAPVAVGLLREARLPQPLAEMDAAGLARLVNDVPIRLEAAMPIARAISSAGGIAFAELDATLMLRRRPGVFIAGEMLDWEAPTGGYLLQACFATGAAAGRGALAWADRAAREAARVS